MREPLTDDVPPGTSTGLRWPRLLLFSLAASLAGLSLIELAMRLLVPQPQDPLPNAPLPPSAELLWEMPPGDHPVNGLQVHINSLGLRGAEPTIPKPQGIKRLLTVGDSSIFGFGVDDAEVFSSVAATLLGPQVEAVNGGMIGYSSYQSLNLLTLRALKVSPDLLVVGSFWSDNNMDSFVDRELLGDYAQRLESPASRANRLLSHSVLYASLRGLLLPASTQQVGWTRPGTELTRSRRRVEINEYAQNLWQMVMLAREAGASTLFLLPSNAEDLAVSVNPRPVWNPYRDVMRDVARRSGCPLLEVPALFQATGLSRAALFLDELHPTVLGHAHMGEALAKQLKQDGWLEGRSLCTGDPDATLPHYEDPYSEQGAPVSPLDPGPSRFVASLRGGPQPAGAGGSGPGQLLSGQPPQPGQLLPGQPPQPGQLLPGQPPQPGQPGSGQPGPGQLQISGLAQNSDQTQQPAPRSGALEPAGQTGVPLEAGPIPAGAPGATRAGGAYHVRGTLICSSCPAGTPQIDAMGLPQRPPPFLGKVRLSAPGPFQLDLPTPGPFFLRVLVDVAGDGPGPGDPHWILADFPLELTAQGLEGVIVDLDTSSVRREK